jgi:hypothetical protein
MRMDTMLRTEKIKRFEPGQVVARNLRNGKDFQEKIQRATKQGNLIWLEAAYTPIYCNGGKVVGVVKVATDITERETTTVKVASELQQMSEELSEKAEAGIKRSEEATLAGEGF